MSNKEFSPYVSAAAGAAVGAIVASTGRVIPHPLTGLAWPYVVVGIAGLAMIAYEKTRSFGVGLAAYGLAKVITKTMKTIGTL